MKKEMIRKRNTVPKVMALFTVFMMTAAMTLAGTFEVFADDTYADQGQKHDKIRDVSKKQEITFRGSVTPGGGADPINMRPQLSGHGQSGNHDAGWGNSEYDEQLSPDGGGISGGNDGGGHELKNDWTSDPDPNLTDLTDFGSDGGNMYPFENPDSDNNNEIDNTSSDDLNTEPSEDDQLSSGPLPEEGGEQPADPEKDKKDVPEIEKDQAGKDGRTGNRIENDPGIADAAVLAYTPARTKVTSGRSSKKKATVSFNKVPKNVTGYQIAVTDRKTGEVRIVYAKKSSGKTIRKTIRGLRKNTKYSVKVRAYNTVGTMTYCAPWSNARSFRTKK